MFLNKSTVTTLECDAGAISNVNKINFPSDLTAIT